MRRAGALLGLSAAAAAGQLPLGTTELAAMKVFGAERAAGHPLAAVRALEPVAFDPAGKPMPNGVYTVWSQFAPMLSEQRPAAAPSPAATPLAATLLAPLHDVQLADAIAAITERARATRVVILNEGHRYPRDRAFALEVARALRPLGFRGLALETLDVTGGDAAVAGRIARITRDGYLRRADGSYSQDPAYADFVRQALKLGYRPVAYEDASGAADTATRDQAEAANLARVLASRTDKLFVYVGLSHAAETPPSGRGPLWMAGRLKAMTGIDPLTIDQTSLDEDPAGGFNEQGRRVLAPRVGTRSAVLMKSAPFVWGPYAGAVDLQVIHPGAGRVDGRPDWLLGMGRRPSPVPPALLPAHGLRLVQAFLAGEAADAVPIDQVLVAAGRPAPALMLPPGKPVRYATEDAPEDPLLDAARQ